MTDKPAPPPAPSPPPQAASGKQEVAVLLATRGMVLALGVLTQGVLAYILMPEGRGAYAICVLFGDLSGVIISLGTARGSQYFVMSKLVSVSQGVSVAFAFSLVGSAIAILVGLPLIHSGLAFFDNADTSSFYLALTLIPTSLLTSVVVMQFEGLRRFNRLALFFFLRSVVGTLGILILVWALDYGVNGAVTALALGQAAMVICCVADLRRNCGLEFELPTREGMRGVLRYGLKEYGARIGQVIDPRMGTLLLGFVATPAQIGLFATSSTLISRAHLISAAVAAYLLPRIADDEAGRPDLAAFCARATWWIIAALLLIWVAVSTPIVPLLLSEAFAPVTRLTWIMSIGVLAYTGTEIFVAYFRGMNRPQVFSYAMWFGLAVNVALFFLLYPRWGLYGATWALTASHLCRSLVLWIAFLRSTRLPASATLLLRRADVAYLWESAVGLARRAARGA